MDAGAGSGLAGRELLKWMDQLWKQYSSVTNQMVDSHPPPVLELTAIDISPAMIEICRQRNIYHNALTVSQEIALNFD